MRKIVAGLLVAGTILSAGPYTQKDRVADMQTMAKAMEEIQTGFFYNNFDMIKEGTGTLSDTIVKIQPPLEEEEEKDVMTRYMNNKVKMSNKIKKKINNKTRVILERFRDGDAVQALQAYTKIAKQCMECHTQLRKW